jgi:two-component system, OmpR family, response regulator RegX3
VRGSGEPAGSACGRPSPAPTANAVSPPSAASVPAVAIVVRIGAIVVLLWKVDGHYRRAPSKRPATDGKGWAKSLERAVAPVTFAPMPEAGRPTILLVEDERSIAEPFAGALAREGFEPLIAPTAKDALELFHRHDPNLVLLDIALPDGDGRDIARELRRESAVPIIMLTARGTETDRVVGLELGADDYVVKPFSAAEVIARIRAVLRRTGRAATPDPPVEIDGLRLDPGARTATLDGEPLDLSRKEFDLLARLMRDAGRVVTREDLMADVWDENWFGSTKTLDVHIGFLRRKLADDAAEPRFLHTVRGVGFRFTGPEGT